jgi:hypothetical protein
MEKVGKNLPSYSKFTSQAPRKKPLTSHPGSSVRIAGKIFSVIVISYAPYIIPSSGSLHHGLLS